MNEATLTMDTPSNESRYVWVVHVIVVVSALAFIFCFQYLPFQDYADWLYQGALFRDVLMGGTQLSQQFQMYAYWPPNAISTVLIGTFATVFPIAIAGKIFLALEVLIVYFGMWSFLKMRSGTSLLLWPILAAFLIYGRTFWTGNINFVFGLGAALLSIVFISKRGKTIGFTSICLLSLLCYSSHFIAWFILGYYLVVTAIADKNWSLLRKVLIGNIPSVALFVWYLIAKNVPNAVDHDWPSGVDWITGHVSLALGVAFPFQNIWGVMSEPFAWMLNMGTALVVACAILFALAKALLKRDWKFMALTVPILAGALLLPFTAAGIVAPGERLVVFGLLLTAAYVVKYARGLAQPMAVVVAMLFASMSWYYTEAAENFNKIIAADWRKRPIHRDEIGAGGGIHPFIRQDYYEAIDSNQVRSIFVSGLFEPKK